MHQLRVSTFLLRLLDLTVKLGNNSQDTVGRPVAHHRGSGLHRKLKPPKMYKLSLITCLVILSESVFARTFDQRQTGDLNVQVDVKNLKIFALTKGKEEYVVSSKDTASSIVI